MRNFWKYCLIGVGTMVLQWIFIVLFFEFFNGLPDTARVILGVGCFLAFEIVICMGVILNKIENR